VQVFLGDEITLVKNGTHVVGQVSGIVLDDRKELERIYIHEVEAAFWMNNGWKVIEEINFDEEDEDGEI